jgi:hypothetical protein
MAASYGGLTGPSGAWYQIESQALGDSPQEPGGVLRVLGAIDDGGGWTTNFPTTAGFLLAADGSFADD